jgi:hypothetical protein
MRGIRLAGLAAALALGAAACSAVDAAPPSPAPPEPPPVAALEIISRLSTATTGGTPGLHGLDVDDAARAAGEHGATLRVVVMGDGTAISAQYPSPGEALPDDATITVWRGDPPTVVTAADPSPPSGGSPTHPPTPSDPDGSPPPVAAAPPEPAPAPSHPPRINPIRLPEAETGLVLTGLASWYGEEFAGRNTACGEVFDPGELTLATRELRCGTVVRITGPTGASVEAVATDWGPAEWTGRRFDLSAATFAAIHHPGAGVISVTVEVLSPG